jgi:hypothetical protein
VKGGVGLLTDEQCYVLWADRGYAANVAARPAMAFFTLCAVLCALGMVTGIARPDLGAGLLGAAGVPLSVWLVEGASAARRDGSPPRRMDTSRRGWTAFVASVAFAVFGVNLVMAVAPDASRAAVAAAEVVVLAAGLMWVRWRRRVERVAR